MAGVSNIYILFWELQKLYSAAPGIIEIELMEEDECSPIEELPEAAIMEDAGEDGALLTAPPQEGQLLSELAVSIKCHHVYIGTRNLEGYSFFSFNF